MKNPCKPGCESRNTYCHSHCEDYKKWKMQYKSRDKEEKEYLGYVRDAIWRMKGGRWT